MITTNHEALSIRQQCKLLAVNRASIYYKEEPKADETEISNEIHEINDNHKRVARIMKEIKIKSI